MCDYFSYAKEDYSETEPLFDEKENKAIGIILHFPKAIINDCKHKFWMIHDEELKRSLDDAIKDQEHFNQWCIEQKEIDNRNPILLRNRLKILAYVLAIANERNYVVDIEFCRRIELHQALGAIALCGATPCLHPASLPDPRGKYLRIMHCICEF